MECIMITGMALIKVMHEPIKQHARRWINLRYECRISFEYYLDRIVTWGWWICQIRSASQRTLLRRHVTWDHVIEACDLEGPIGIQGKLYPDTFESSIVRNGRRRRQPVSSPSRPRHSLVITSLGFSERSWISNKLASKRLTIPENQRGR
jgi:hypothetical protein